MTQNSRTYPIQQVTDRPTQDALRLVWDRVHDLSQTVKGPPAGTLNPDQKPVNLGVKDAGLTFYSTDFNRTYKWNGSGWEDAPNAPPRNHTARFLTSPSPPVGWAQCNGSQVTISTPDGRTQYFQTPVVQPDANGFVTWVRL